MPDQQRRAPALVLTGERTLPGIWHENYWFRRHEIAYQVIVPWVAGAVVLDAGPGEGYGAAILARHARRVVSVDYDAAAVRHNAHRYGARAGAVRGDLQRLPLRDNSVEVVVSMQVIEHLHDQPGFLCECARVLRPAGTLAISTPNRLTFSPGRETPLNPFHTRELSATELEKSLDERFTVTRMWGVRHGRRLRHTEKKLGTTLMDAQLAGPPETWAPKLRRLVARTGARDFVVGERDIDGSLDLLAIAVKRP